MLKKLNSFFISLVIVLGTTSCNKIQMPIAVQKYSLKKYDYISASVLPTITESGELYGVFAREAYGKKYKLGKFHKYDDFSGSREDEDTNAATSAAREFLEEGILPKTIGLDLEMTESFIDHHNKNTWAVIVYSKDANECDPHSKKIRNVTYLTHFDKHKTKFFRNFYRARRQEEERYNKEHVKQSQRTTIEKDRIAKISWKNLEKAILDQEDPNDLVEVDAFVLNPRTGKFVEERVTLRPFLVIKLRSFFLDNPYEQGDSQKIRFYKD